MGDHTRQSVLDGEESEWVGLSLPINKRGSALIRFAYGHLPEISLAEKKQNKKRVHSNYKPKKANNLKKPHQSSPVFLKLEHASDLLEG